DDLGRRPAPGRPEGSAARLCRNLDRIGLGGPVLPRNPVGPRGPVLRRGRANPSVLVVRGGLAERGQGMGEGGGGAEAEVGAFGDVVDLEDLALAVGPGGPGARGGGGPGRAGDPRA